MQFIPSLNIKVNEKGPEFSAAYDLPGLLSQSKDPASSDKLCPAFQYFFMENIF
jgi:hypothetical protein